MYRTNPQTMLKRVGTSGAVVLGALATGVGIAGASAHHSAKLDGPSSASSAPLADRARSLGGLVTAFTATSLTVQDWKGTFTTYTIGSSTKFTKERTAASPGDLAIGEHVRIILSSTSSVTASAVEIELASVAGQVVTVSGNAVTVTDRSGTSVQIDVSAPTTYSKNGARATLADVTTGSFDVAEGGFDSTDTVLTATTIGIGQPMFGGGHDGVAMLGTEGRFGQGVDGDHGRMGNFSAQAAQEEWPTSAAQAARATWAKIIRSKAYSSGPGRLPPTSGT